MLTNVYCNSLPSLLFGHNGQVFENQTQYQEAIDELKRIVSQVAYLPPPDEWEVYRIDLAWNFNLRARPIILAHELLRIPGIRKSPAVFDGGYGISWLGYGSLFCVKLYDKARKMGCTKESALRAEISLCGKYVNRHFNGIEWMAIEALRRTFREIMGTLPSIDQPIAAPGWQEAIALLPREQRTQIFAALEPTTPDRTFRRWRARTVAAVHRMEQRQLLSWAELLNLPAFHVLPKNKRRGLLPKTKSITICHGKDENQENRF